MIAIFSDLNYITITKISLLVDVTLLQTAPSNSPNSLRVTCSLNTRFTIEAFVLKFRKCEINT